jgi:hypothetical protein
VRERLESIGIPPAWTDVWIVPYDNGHIQATGLDAVNENGSHGLATLLCAHVLDHFSARETIDPPAGRTRPNRNCARCCTGRAT